MEDDAALLDIDTPEALAALREARVMSFDAGAIRAAVPDLRRTGRQRLPLSRQRRDRADLPAGGRRAARASRPQNRANVKRGIYPLAEAATDAFDEARAQRSPPISASPIRTR